MTRIVSLIAILFIYLMCCGSAYALTPITQGRTPLLQNGKKSLYQRVISHPGASLAKSPGGDLSIPVRTFTPFYVYARSQANGEEWLEVSPSSNGADILGWIRGSDCSLWDKALTLMFSDRMGRDPALFFRGYSDLNRLVRSDNMRLSIDRLLANSGKENSPLLATEPQNSAIPRKQFYLMPVFNYSDEYEQYNLRLLNTGIIDPGTPKPSASIQSPKPQTKSGNFKAGLVFIVDTTISMKPYIEQTKKFVHSAYDALSRSNIAQDVAFGVVAYRNSTRYNEKLEYVSTVVAPFASVGKRAQAEAMIAQMDEAKVSTHAFNEDAFAGLKTTIDELDWSPYAVKMAVLVTDAGAIRNSDPYSSTGLNEKEMGDLLAQKGIRLVVIHLQTKQGKKHNMPGVIAQYKQLTKVRDGNVKSTYIGLPVHDIKTATQQFSRIAEALMDVLQKIVQSAAQGGKLTKPVASAQEAEENPERTASYFAECLGYAAYLEFAGKVKNTTPPHLVEAWVADKDLDNLSHGKSTDVVRVCVLLNKRQLDAMARQISLLVDAARASRSYDSRGLFQRIVSLSSQAIRDPERMQRKSGANLCETGLLPEFLLGLPYKSDVMKLTEAHWIAMSSQEQDELISSLSAKVKLYTEYHNDTDNWIQFGSSDPSEALYRVPLTSLP